MDTFVKKNKFNTEIKTSDEIINLFYRLPHNDALKTIEKGRAISLTFDINTVGYSLSGLEVKRSQVR